MIGRRQRPLSFVATVTVVTALVCPAFAQQTDHDLYAAALAVSESRVRRSLLTPWLRSRCPASLDGNPRRHRRVPDAPPALPGQRLQRQRLVAGRTPGARRLHPVWRRPRQRRRGAPPAAACRRVPHQQTGEGCDCHRCARRPFRVRRRRPGHQRPLGASARGRAAATIRSVRRIVLQTPSASSSNSTRKSCFTKSALPVPTGCSSTSLQRTRLRHCVTRRFGSRETPTSCARSASAGTRIEPRESSSTPGASPRTHLRTLRPVPVLSSTVCSETRRTCAASTSREASGACVEPAASVDHSPNGEWFARRRRAGASCAAGNISTGARRRSRRRAPGRNRPD